MIVYHLKGVTTTYFALYDLKNMLNINYLAITKDRNRFNLVTLPVPEEYLVDDLEYYSSYEEYI